MNFCVWNTGYDSLPHGTPISFFNGDPRLPGAVRIGLVTLSGGLAGNCQRCVAYNITGRFIDYPRIYIVVNNDGAVLPLNFTTPFIIEKNYNNNIGIATISFPTITRTICYGDNVFGYTTSGVYVDTLTNPGNGCLSIRTLRLTVRPNYVRYDTLTICAGQSYMGHNATGNYVDRFRTSEGCDSSFYTNLTVRPPLVARIDSTVCEGAAVYGHQTTGTFVEVFPGSTGCDSTRTLRLVVNPVRRTTLNKEICEGDSLFVQGQWKRISGTYYDTLRTYLNCDSILITNLLVHPKPKPDLGINRGICPGDSLLLNPGTFDSYLWNDGSTSPEFIVHGLGTYSVTVQDAFNCTNRDTVKILNYYPAVPQIFLPPDSSLCANNIVELRVPGYKTYAWSNGGTQSSIQVTQAGVYTLRVISNYGCKGADSIRVFFFDNCVPIQVPNAFTPNRDGKNDVFMPLVTMPLKEYRFLVYNRSGTKVFETRDRFKGWDGRFKGMEQSVDNYVY
ncbi:MAG: T9SS type B sorting domain-containing protein, partial [Sphingobacteriales bacterium]